MVSPPPLLEAHRAAVEEEECDGRDKEDAEDDADDQANLDVRILGTILGELSLGEEGSLMCLDIGVAFAG